MAFCQSKGGIPYFETSAKEAINVEQAFEGRLSTLDLLENISLMNFYSYRPQRIGPGGERRFQC
jgi:hypothetical protein